MARPSLGNETDLFFPRFEGQVVDRGPYLVVRTPANPTFYWGNYLIFDAPPGERDFPRWMDLFVEELGRPPQVRHVLFGWSGGEPSAAALAPFTREGFELSEDLVLATSAVHAPPHPNTEATFRPLETDAEWAEALEHQVLMREPHFDEAPYRDFKARQLARYRRMADAGRGAWFGAFLGERLVADLGLFHEGPLARYQSVETHPDFRRRGLCGTLVWRAAEYAREHWGVKQWVIVAVSDGPATSIYTSVGFEFVERKLALLRPPGA
ncbi:GNAT family N-acetyltransferase [Archangium violaceum]|uniref:GNAT family N-acetyltransferase n=1 Tax=Archangium violaceum TaxID=83451 RepID=UPI00194F7913|nr:GNAT family N-acetyltransferase [Archangium violaceum]QRN99140.1 GNAT family N-acetyltransferase [Archangium violaceum]